jgi:peptidyl-prolyl cis-trans isomerase A (cyclophilin A)
MRSRLAVLIALGAALAGCRGTETSAPAPAATATAAAPAPSSTPAPAATPTASPSVTSLRPLLDPQRAREQAPDRFRVRFDTTKGPFVVEVTRAWAPRGADRFYNLVKRGFYDNCRFFRVVPTFMVQFGIHGDPAVSAAWARATIPDDRARISNTRGRVTFAKTSAPDSRTTQVFINFGDNSRLDRDGFAPFGEVVTSMVLVERIYSGYGEAPDQGRIETEGNAFLATFFPRLDYIKKATIEP